MEEEWRTVPSVPEISASNLGRILVAPCVRSVPNGGVRTYTPKPTYGYEETTATGRPGVPKRRIIRVGRLKRTFKIAQIVCEAFHGPKPFPKAVTIHLDENPSNNAPNNLKWGTQKENLNMPKFKEWQKTIRVGDNSPVRKAQMTRSPKQLTDTATLLLRNAYAQGKSDTEAIHFAKSAMGQEHHDLVDTVWRDRFQTFTAN